MSGAMPPLPQYAFMAWCSVKTQGQLYLYLYYHRISFSVFQLDSFIEVSLSKFCMNFCFINSSHIFDVIDFTILTALGEFYTVRNSSLRTLMSSVSNLPYLYQIKPCTWTDTCNLGIFLFIRSTSIKRSHIVTYLDTSTKTEGFLSKNICLI
jgi:hypothetical protein